jgi:hypothetical protein
LDTFEVIVFCDFTAKITGYIGSHKVSRKILDSENQTSSPMRYIVFGHQYIWSPRYNRKTLWLSCLVLPLSLYYPFLIAPSVFSSVYFQLTIVLRLYRGDHIYWWPKTM